jgi:hypothetical protein
MTMGSGWSRGEAPDPDRKIPWGVEHITTTYGNPVRIAEFRLATARAMLRVARCSGAPWSHRRILRRAVRAARADLAAAYLAAGQ